MSIMVTHARRVRPNAFGGTSNGSLCGRLNAASRDGMNITDDRIKVTCKFCLSRLAADDARASKRR